MPLARSWAEELVAEYYALKGYSVLTNIPIGVGKGGGRKDLDVLAVDAAGRSIYVVNVKVWVEATKKIIESVESNLEEAVRYLKSIYGKEYNYVKVSVIVIPPNTPALDTIRQALKEKGVTVVGLHELIAELISYIDTWREEMVKRGIAKTEKLMLPENLYLLKLLEYLKDSKMIV